MKILLSHRFFWPDTAPYAVMLRSLGEAFTEAGHDVHVFTGRPSYNSSQTTSGPSRETVGGVRVRRTFVFADEKRTPVRRLLNVILYCAGLFVEVLRQRSDVVTASSFPPVVAAATACFAARLAGAKFIYHVQDIHPEVSQVSGGRLGRGLPFRLLRWLDNRTLRHAAAVVTLSDDMEATLRARGVQIRHLVKTDNFALEVFNTNEPTNPVEVPDTGYRVIFAGNLGRFQDLLLLSEGVARCFDDHPNLELLFLGSGVMEADLKARWHDHPQVRFLPFRPLAEVRPIIAGADLGLVSLMPRMSTVARPSKLLTYEGLGLPVLVLTNYDSALARDIEASGAGVAARSRTPEGIEDALRRALAEPALKERAQTLARQVDRQAEAVAVWTQLLATFR